MKQRVLVIVLILCLCMSAIPTVYAEQDDFTEQDDTAALDDPAAPEDSTIPAVVPDDTATPEDPVTPENSSPEETPVTPETSLPEEAPAEPETPLPEEAPAEPEIPLPEKAPVAPSDAILPEEPSSEELLTEEEPAQEETIMPEDFAMLENLLLMDESGAKPVLYADVTVPTPHQVYETLIALKDTDGYREGTPWDEQNHSYNDWKGGPVAGINTKGGIGCAAFAFDLSDRAFGYLPARTIYEGDFSISDVRAGDILQVKQYSHFVIVLRVDADGVVIAEGNMHINGGPGQVHWDRSLSRTEVETANFLLTRYPENYIPPDDPTANEVIASGSTGNLTWELVNMGTFTISGSGAMPDFDDLTDRPWNAYLDKIQTIRIGSGVTKVGSNAFRGSNAFSVSIPDTVTTIGSGAFYGSALISVVIPGSVQTIGNDAFRECMTLVSVSVSEGLQTIGECAFRSCNQLLSITLPASVRSVGAAAFSQCSEMTSAVFTPGTDAAVTMGDDMFSQCYKLANLTLPRSADRIADRMFQNCGYLTSVVIPQGVEGIGDHAFASCGLRSVYIPGSVTQIGIAAFAVCPLERIDFGGSEAQWNAISKIGDTGTALAKVPVINYNVSAPAAQEPANPPATQEPTPPPAVQEPAKPSEPEEPAKPSEPEEAAKPSNPSAVTKPSDSLAAQEAANLLAAQEAANLLAMQEAANLLAAQEAANLLAMQEAANLLAAQEAANLLAAQEAANLLATQDAADSSEPGEAANPPAAQEAASAAVADTRPYMPDDPDRDGWDVIEEKAVNAPEGNQISVNMNGTSIVPGNVLDSIKGRDISLAVDMDNGVTWVINGKNITSDHVDDIDLSVQVDSAAISQSVIENVFEERPSTQLSLAHSGDFGYSAVLVINVNSENAGLYANLFYFNPDTDAFEFISADQVAEDGTAELDFTHASDYVIVIDGGVMDDSFGKVSSESGVEATDSDDSQARGIQSPKADDIETTNHSVQQNNSLIWIVLIGAVVIAAAGAVVFLIQKKTGKK